MEFMEKRRKHFAALRSQEKRKRLPTKTQKRNQISIYLKHMGGYKHNQLKGRSYDEIQKLFDKEMKRVNSFVAMNSEAQEISGKKDKGSSKKAEIVQDSSAKRAGDKLEYDKSKKQNTNENKEVEVDNEAELKKHMVTVKDDDIAIDAIPLATKPLVIIAYKLIREGIMGHYQLIRADGSFKRYSSMIRMLQGGSTAIILTYVLREQKELSTTTCVIFAPGACMTWELADSGNDFLKSIINGADLVPTFSAASVDDLRAEVIASAWLNDLRTPINHTRILRTVYRSASALGSRLPSIASAKAKVVGAGGILRPISSGTQSLSSNIEAQSISTALKLLVSSSDDTSEWHANELHNEEKGVYDIWAMKMEHYLGHTDYPIWEVMQKGNGPVQVSTDTNGQIRVLPPKTGEEILARERERKARTTLLMSIPEDHLVKFHKMTDAKEMNNLKAFLYLLSQLEIHGAGVSTEDANQKFLWSLPTSLSQVSLIMRTKPGVDSLSFDDLYNNLRVFEHDVKGSTGSSSSTQNVTFVSSSTRSTNDVSTAYGVSTSSGHNSQKEGASSYTDKLKYSFFANQSSGPQLDHEDLEQVDEFDLEEMDLKWQVAMISMTLKKFYKKTGRRLKFDAKEPVGFDKTKVECFNCHNTGRRPGKQKEPKALVTLDGDGVDWTSHAEDE
ncbi:ribonuclease H-like domain-containing protein [Tanacetum coccineum]|uniref:Ribonuclease H-like domain-containing protein n=1 Tax=Tanacetum coccineum TaxID=301880 RepID=A0ABQ5EF86_9ASTR